MKSRKRKRLLKKIYIAGGAVITAAAAVAVCLLFFQKIKVNDDSMSPAFQSGQTVRLDMFSYMFRSPARGETVLVKKKQGDKTVYYIRRIAGLPGERVQIKDNVLYIEDKAADDGHFSGISDAGRAANTVALTKDEYFVLGDNERVSDDSRQDSFGNISRGEICGRVWQ